MTSELASLQLSAPAHQLATRLHTALRARWDALPGDPDPPAPPEYAAAPIPTDLRGRRAELIVEASDVDALRQALASDADAVVIDFDDTFAPTRANVQAAYDALAWATSTSTPLLARPRALYAVEQGLDFDGPGIASLCDLAAIVAARPQQPIHLYIPKLETVAEAKFWEDALAVAEAELNLAPNAIRVCLQIETFLGVLHADALLYALRGRAYGLNAGRWDYVFSLTKWVGRTSAALPPRAELGMEVDAMRAYAEALVRVCQRRNAEAIGGSAAVAPDPSDTQSALNTVQADKRREALQGFTAAWAGLPDLLAPVRAGFEGVSAEPLPPESPERTRERLLNLPGAQVLPLNTVQDTIGLALAVFRAWYAGRGVVVRGGRIEDTATAELARAQLWQWVGCGAELDGGERLTAQCYLHERRAQADDATPEAKLLDHLVLTELCIPYFPRAAQSLPEASA
ncbi:malate synthase A [Deinococcus sp. Arct2-2]|uniref:aldolase/citrate lyase family protein n=1 Tax=Deinococcus sp. Arct2-2 TaxID=2568653 RepID=UPI0010A57829|nr:aldolase/citrate lyase family protein [Deinococcus sp. Arct2-2]THF71608.1 malate synthase A [Deinococcus sp. Arct2-2]